MPRILVLYNKPVLPPDDPDAESEYDILPTVEAVHRTIAAAGLEVVRLGIDRDPGGLLAGLRRRRPDAVFNLFEGTGDQADNEAYVAGILEWLRIPFTGCPHQALALARNKQLSKRLFQGAGLPTAPFFVVERLPVPKPSLDWPLIVKPAMQDGSVGLDQGSVVTNLPKLRARVGHLLERYRQPVLVEEFIAGRELNVGVIERENGSFRALPISASRFLDRDPKRWPIVTYDAKWKPDSRDYQATPPQCPASVAPKLARRLEALAIQAFRVLGCRDYARVDFRVRPSGKPYLLEVNPNPDFSPTAGLAGALQAAGLSHAQFTLDLVRAALARLA